MECVVFDTQGGQLLVGDLDTLGIPVRVKFGVHSEPFAGGGGPNEVDRDLVTGQRLAPPTRRDLTE